MSLNNIYYTVKPAIPRRLQILLRRRFIDLKRQSCEGVWPIYEEAGRAPEGWKGWPGGKRFALVLTHDVETQRGHERCRELAKLEKSLGFRSSFNFVPERYEVSPSLRDYLSKNGFEVGVHDLYHDGKLFRSRKIFSQRAERINRYIKAWGSKGFRAGSMHSNLEWMHELEIKYDSSTFDTDPFEPQNNSTAGTIFPFRVENNSGKDGYVELPYTLPQDFTLFILMQETNIGIWKRKLDWISERGGMALLNTHPDYMSSNGGNSGTEEYPAYYYREFLQYVKSRYEGQYWLALPKEVAEYSKNRSKSVSLSASKSLPKSDERFKNQRDREKGAVLCRKKICMLAYTFYETDSRVRMYAEALAKRGDHVDIIALGKPGQPPRETLNGVNIYRIQKREVNERLRLTFFFRLLKFLVKSSFFLTGKHLQNSYDVIHVHSVPDFEVFAAWLPKITGSALILDIHDLVPEFYTSKFSSGSNTLLFKALVLVEKLSILFSDHVIIPNHLWHKKLVRRSVDEKKCSVILNYPDTDIFHRRPVKKDKDKFVLIYPGTLNWHQGVDIAIRAFSMIKDDVPNAEFHIYGGGSSKNSLIKLASELGLHGRVFFKNQLPLEEIAEVVANADLGIVPKRDNSFGSEAFSTKILEFMALNVPVVVSGTKIDRYYFDDTLVKFFQPGDEKNLAQSILLLINDPDLRNRLVNNSLEYIKKNNWEIKKAEYLKIVDSLCGRGLKEVKSLEHPSA
ncbi:MAG TPA: glycosyltransferase [Syntrophales bacterium]|nr:glycosyltransferase [Syntrophales bacterium]